MKDTPRKLVNIKEHQGGIRTSISFSQMTYEQFEDHHNQQAFVDLSNWLIRQFSDVFKENLGLEDRLDVEPVKV